jgi:hypothetical protein
MDAEWAKQIRNAEEDATYEAELAARITAELEEAEHAGRMTRWYLRGLCTPENKLDKLFVNDDVATYISGIWLRAIFHQDEEGESAIH